VRELVNAGDIQRSQAQEWVDNLVERSRKTSEQVLELVRHEVATQLGKIDGKSLETIANQVADILKKSAVAGRSATKDVTKQAGKTAKGVRSEVGKTAKGVRSEVGKTAKGVRSEVGKTATRARAAATKVAPTRRHKRKPAAKKAPAKNSAAHKAPTKKAPAKKTSSVKKAAS